jgi:Flp pilus assembly protein TadG
LNRRGAAAVEFALVAPLLFMLVLGIIEIGRGLMMTNMLTNAARVGCRTGILPDKSSSDVQAAVTNYLNALGVTTESISVEVNDVAADAGSAKGLDEITVIVSIAVNDVTWVPKAQYLAGKTLTVQFTMPKE